jgi:hypothetical protein
MKTIVLCLPLLIIHHRWMMVSWRDRQCCRDRQDIWREQWGRPVEGSEKDFIGRRGWMNFPLEPDIVFEMFVDADERSSSNVRSCCSNPASPPSVSIHSALCAWRSPAATGYGISPDQSSMSSSECQQCQQGDGEERKQPRPGSDISNPRSFEAGDRSIWPPPWPFLECEVEFCGHL